MVQTLEGFRILSKRTIAWDKEYSIIYPLIGLQDETSEFIDHLTSDKKITKAERKSLLIKELGDIAWYLVAIATDLDISFTKLGDLKNFNAKDSCSKTFSVKEISEIVLGVEKHIGVIYGTVKKLIRDGDKKVSLYDKCQQTEKIATIHFSILAIFTSLVMLANKLGITIEEALQKNIDKIASRKERGVLQGSGDNR